MALNFVFLTLLALASANPLNGFRDPDSYEVLEGADQPASYEEFVSMINTTEIHHPKISELVFGGQYAQPGNFPFQVFISYAKRDGRYYQCGGSLLSPTHVLTACHCTIDMIAPAKIMVGNVHLRGRNQNTQWSNVQRIYNHPNYRQGNPSYLYDIAILEINPVQLNQAVRLTRFTANDQQLRATGSAIISGFGTYTFQGNEPVSSENLLYSQLQIYNNNYCKSQWERFTGGRSTVTPSQMCAGGQGRGSGPGDSGGPLSVNTQNGLIQVGLVSFGPMDPRIMAYQQDQFPAVFTRVGAHCDFIQHYSRQTARCLSQCSFLVKY
uniref:Elastase-like serine protease n=1 Tax=Steinernema carpocapsae TaxID=34508 RepID=C1KBZ2_STECR|nr:elastase-like serine protease [Steinernema carpocapsae]